MAITNQSSGSSGILDLAQLQVWAQHTDITLKELSNTVTRLNALVSQLIKLNNLTTPK